MNKYQEYLETIKDKKTRKILEYLLSISQDKNSVMFSCTGLGDAVNIYRQTVSKKILDLEALGFVTINERYHIFNAAFTRSYIETKLISSDEMSNKFKKTGDESSQKLISIDENDLKSSYSDPSKLISTDENSSKLITKLITTDENASKLISSDENSQKFISTDELSNIFKGVFEEILKENVENYNLNAFSDDFIATYSALINKKCDHTPESYAEALIRASVNVTTDLFIPLRKKEKRNEETDRKKKEINKESPKMLIKTERSEVFKEGVKENDDEILRDGIGKGQGLFKNSSAGSFPDSEPITDQLGIIELKDPCSPSEEYKAMKETVRARMTGNITSSLSKNPYENKPFLPVDKFMEMTNSLDPDETITSPLRLFFNAFWWGLWDLYKASHHIYRIDENGNEVEEEIDDDSKMLHSQMFVDDVYRLAINIYEDIKGAAELGVYEDEFGTYKTDFKNFQEFNPVYLFDWQATDTDEFEIVMDRFRDIEAEDIVEDYKPVFGREAKRLESQLNKKYIASIMKSEQKELSGMDRVVRAFYDSFVIMDDSGFAKKFTDSNHQELVDPITLPDYLINDWVHKMRFNIKPADLTSLFQMPYRPMDGLRIVSYLFSCRKIARYNEIKGITDSIASRTLRTA